MIVVGCISFIVGEIIAKILGQFHSNLQPFAELQNVNKLLEKDVDNSFPSELTMLFFCFSVTFWLFGKRYRTLWIIFAVAVGFSRIWVGAHYPFDVIVGALVGMCAALLTYRVVPKFHVIESFLQRLEKLETNLFKVRDKSKTFKQ